MLFCEEISKKSRLLNEYGSKNAENARRIEAVLKDDFKPLFGIKGTVFLIAQLHTPKDSLSHIMGLIGKKDLEGIHDFVQNSEFPLIVKEYRDNIKQIEELIGSHDITTFFNENTPEETQDNLGNLKENWQLLIDKMTEAGVNPELIDDILLYILSPDYYMHAQDMLPGVEIKGMEGPSRDFHRETKIPNPQTRFEWERWRQQSSQEMLDRDREMSETIMQQAKRKSLVQVGCSHSEGISLHLAENARRVRVYFTQQAYEALSTGRVPSLNQ